MRYVETAVLLKSIPSDADANQFLKNCYGKTHTLKDLISSIESNIKLIESAEV